MSASQAELLLAAQLEQAGIPFHREYRFHPERRWRADFVVDRGAVVGTRSIDGAGTFRVHEIPGILIEVDGGSWLPKGRHTTGSGFAKDAEKLNAAAELGYRVLRYTPAMIEDGSAIEQIRRILSMKEDRPNAA